MEAWGHGCQIKGRRRQQLGLLALREEEARTSGLRFWEGEAWGLGDCVSGRGGRLDSRFLTMT